MSELIAGYEIHPAASRLPLMPEADLRAMAEDIKARGLDRPVVTFRGQVIDGRNRLLACQLAGIEPAVQEWDCRGASVVKYVIAANLHRRHLNESQKAMLAADLLPMFEAEARERQRASLKQGDEVPSAPRGANGEKGKAAELAAAEVGAAPRSVERAKAVAKHAPELAEQVREGKTTLKQAEKQLRRAEQIKQVKKYRPPEGQFPVIVADPPWPYEDELDGSDAARGGLPYPAQTLDDICANPPPAAADCILWLWVTNAHLVDGSANQVLDAWGFTPKTLLTWVKDRMGAGRWLRGVTEHVILAVKGKPVVSLKNETTAFDAPVGRHSEKPGTFYAMVQRLCPARPLLELNARAPRHGWVTSGAESSEETGHEGDRSQGAVPHDSREEALGRKSSRKGARAVSGGQTGVRGVRPAGHPSGRAHGVAGGRKSDLLEVGPGSVPTRCLGFEGREDPCDGPPSKKGRCPTCTTRHAWNEKRKREGGGLIAWKDARAGLSEIVTLGPREARSDVVARGKGRSGRKYEVWKSSARKNGGGHGWRTSTAGGAGPDMTIEDAKASCENFEASLKPKKGGKR